MASNAPSEPWSSFLADIDAAATDVVVLHCIGGFAVSLYYGLTRPTGDLDVVEVAPDTARPSGGADGLSLVPSPTCQIFNRRNCQIFDRR